MRITAQTHVALNPVRINPKVAIARQASVAPSGPAKPVRPVATSTNSNPFASVFQGLSQPAEPQPTAATAPASQILGTTTVNTTVPAAVQSPGISALVSAIMNGSFKTSYVNDPGKLQEITPYGNYTMPNFYYASDETANQLAQLLGGTVIQRPAFGQNVGWTEPNANFIQLPSGQTFNAADLAYYGRCGVEGPAQLTADITQTINAGAAWTNYYRNGGQIPSFATGYVGPPIPGMVYPPGSIGADGMVINPAMQTAKVNT